MVVRRGSYPQVEPRARDVMTRAVAVGSIDWSIEEAARLVDRDRPDLVVIPRGAGTWRAVTPPTLARALELRLHQARLAACLWPAPGIGAATPEVAVRRRLTPATPFVIVTDRGRLVGAVLGDGVSAHPLPRSAAGALAGLDERSGRLLRLAGELAAREGWAVAAVGGFARELLRGRPHVAPRDLDLSVAGDGRAFARQLARTVGGRAQEHAAFLTATVLLPDEGRVDVVTARRERYRTPGALPEVEPADLAADLVRRDFAVNALGVRVEPAAWGEVLDPAGGAADLQRRVIRVLHPLSFIEDPTRIFRAARFASRLGFRLDAGTAGLARVAAALDVYGALSGERIRAELTLALAEPAPVDVLTRLLRLDAFRLLWPGYGPAGGARAARLVVRVSERAAGLPLQAGTLEQLYLLALTAPISDEAAAAWLERLALPAPTRGSIARARREAPALLARLGEAAGAEQAYACLRGVPEPVAVWAQVLASPGRARRHLSAHLGRWRSLRPLLTGADLSAMGLAPGPRFGHLLEGVRAAQAAGRLTTPAQARAWIRRAVARGAEGNGSRPQRSHPGHRGRERRSV